jgi:phasin family protein
MPGYEEIVAFHKANFEAVVEANKVLAAGLQEISKELVALTQYALETAASTGKQTISAKSVKEAIDLQVETAKTGYEKIVSNSAKLSELGVKVANEALAPVTARVHHTVEKFLKPAA